MQQRRRILWLAALLALGVVGAAARPARADTVQLGNLYVSDYGSSELDRYQYTYNQTTNLITAITPYGAGGNTTSAYFFGGASNPVKEGVHGTASDLIVVGGNHGSGVTDISRYGLDGGLIGTIPVNFSSYNGGNVGIGNVLVTTDGRYMYAPLEAAGAVVKVDLLNGAIVASYAFAKAHDVAIAANGDVYVANYSGNPASVIVLDANLAFKQTLITGATSGLAQTFRPTGLSIAADGSLYVNINKAGGPDSVAHYILSGSSGSMTATLDTPTSYIGSATNKLLEFTFGSNIGPDGKVYIAALGGGGSGSFSTAAGYVDGIYAFDPNIGSMALVIQGFTEASGPGGPSGLSAPKYLQFDTNFVTVPDAGYLPEPGTGWLLLGTAGMFGMVLRRRRG